MKVKQGTNFSQLVKEEVCYLNNFDNESKKILIYTIIKNIGEINIFSNTIEFKIRYLYLLNIIKKILEEQFNSISFEIAKSNTKTLGDNKTNFLITIFDNDEIIFNGINNFFNNLNMKNKYLNVILIGCFLTSGSITNMKNSRYHFEIRVIDKDFHKLLLKIFKKFKLEPKVIEHKNKYVIYFKRSEQISDILKILGATDSMFELEDNRIEHDFVNNMQRLINLEVSNIQKISKASVELTSKCKVLMSDYRFNTFNLREKLFCEIRVKYPMYSMNDICKEMNKQLPIDQHINKGSLSHIVRKIRKIYNEEIIK